MNHEEQQPQRQIPQFLKHFHLTLPIAKSHMNVAMLAFPAAVIQIPSIQIPVALIIL
ncbi:MAG: hypothetical protein ABSE17_03310 [Candidatus Levyibacteriota bacterium]|jgi:hypothetical protein